MDPHPHVLFPFSNLIPISLLVTMETVKLIQALFLQKQSEFLNPLHKHPCSIQVQASNLNEELGQIKYLFSDKTGTLTKNTMVFKRLSAHGRDYGSVTSRNYRSNLPN